jgi:hypothetical protein
VADIRRVLNSQKRLAAQPIKKEEKGREGSHDNSGGTG